MHHPSCLRLFNAVLAVGEPAAEPVFLPTYGVIVSPSAAYAIAAIEAYLNERTLNGEQLNATFHKSWQKVATASTLQLRIEQIVHYLSTYGLEKIGLYSNDTIYIPAEVLDCPENLTLKTVHSIAIASATQQCLELLSQKVALKPETIEDILLVLEDCGYQFTGQELIGNREAACLIADLVGVLPRNGDDLFRYLFYKATDSTLVIKNPASDAIIKASNYQLPSLDSDQRIQLAKSFNRHKPLWMAFKKAHPENPRQVNAIARLSKKHHVPVLANPLSLVTSGKCDPEAIVTFAKTAPLAQVIRAINALRSYAATDARRYRIRNGTSWVKADMVREPDQTLVGDLLAIVQQRINRDLVYYVPPHMDYTLPISEKQFLGNIPIGTAITIPQSEEFLLVGVHWEDAENTRTDLDLSCVSTAGVIAWNTTLRTGDRSLLHSGDVTAAPKPNGAAEYLYAQRLSDPWLVTLHLFSGKLNHPFSFRIGSGSNIQNNYMIDPNKVVFETPLECIKKEMILGLLEPTETGSRFVFIGDAGSNCRVAAFSDRGRQRLQAVLAQSATAVRLSEVLRITNDPTSADVDLSPVNLQRNTLLRLIAG
jgi:hypothetical protein